jgi:hypothetical protein
VAATEATTMATTEAANPVSSEGSRRDCGAAKKDGGGRGHHYFSQHQSLHAQCDLHLIVASCSELRP